MSDTQLNLDRLPTNRRWNMRVRSPRKFLALAVLALSLSVTASASAGLLQFYDGFENGHSAWFTTGGAGFDYGLGLAYKGQGNGWVRNTTGWNAINTIEQVQPWETCTASAWIRLSPHLTGGYMSIRQSYGDWHIINEIPLTGPGPVGDNGYNHYVFPFYSGSTNSVEFYAGLWGNGQDAWMQIDEVVIQCPTPY
jgi:hypothetical protein